LNIGRAAKLAGVNVETIRYYQRRGLVAVPVKPLGSHRHYSQDVVERIRFIKQAQAWGFSLDEIILLLQPPQVVQCVQVQELVQEKIQVLRSRMRDLSRMVRGLESLLEECRGQPSCAQCPLRAYACCRTLNILVPPA
jgi:MerR family mercuric resistance operon transcriptional regulator